MPPVALLVDLQLRSPTFCKVILPITISHIKGKHKPTFTPNKEEGDFVVVTNAERILLTGRKWDQKVYYWHTGWAGGLKVKSNLLHHH